MDFEIKGHEAVAQLIDRIPDEVPVRQPIIEFLESNRYIPQTVSKEYFGYFNIKKYPHLREILECFDPEHPATHISIMKSVQSGITTSVAESVMAYYIYYKLGNILSLTSNREIAKIRGSNIDVMIDNTEGLVEKLVTMSTRIKETRRGDTAKYKEFDGGIQLLMSSYGSIGSMKSIPYSLIVRDEWAEAPFEIGGQGSLDSLIEGRTMATSRYKILSLSTPSHAGKCQMERSFLQGDQRRWFVPCPHCGKMQTLVLNDGHNRHGLVFKVEKNLEVIPESVVYNCIGCDKHFFDEHKRIFMQQGEWRPSWTDENPPKKAKHYSYHISGLISPFLPWVRICEDYVKTDFGKDILEYKNFSINMLGEAWEYIEEKPDWMLFKQRADDYVMGEIPDGGLILFGGADVQGNRLELCVCAFGEGMECWLIDYEVFNFEKGKEHSLDESAWEELRTYVYNYKHEVLGNIRTVSIDSRYDPEIFKHPAYSVKSEKREGLVEQFCLRNSGRFTAVQGHYDPKNSIVYGLRKTKKTANIVDTDSIKHAIFSNIKKTSGERSIHFPKYRFTDGKLTELSDYMFKSFCSEQYYKGDDGKMRWTKIFKRNEVLDCMVYAFAGAYSSTINKWSKEQWDQYRGMLKWD